MAHIDSDGNLMFDKKHTQLLLKWLSSADKAIILIQDIEIAMKSLDNPRPVSNIFLDPKD